MSVTATATNPRVQASWLVVPAFVAVSAYVVAFSLAMEKASYDVSGAFLLAPVLIALSVPIMARVARRENDPRMLRILVAALVVKLLGSLVRYFVAFQFYGGVSDANGYHAFGRRVAASFWAGNFDVDVGGQVVGTGFMNLFTGVVYTVTGPTKVGGFLVFSWLGFWGLYLFYRAFRLAVPDGNYRRYALLVFFLPSLVYWPSSIGKEAWMTLTLGLAAYGAARLLVHQRGGFVLLGLGLAGTSMVRPHVSFIVFVGLLVGYLLRRRGRGMAGPFLKVVGLAVLLLIGAVLAARLQSFFKLESLDSATVERTLVKAQDRSSKGGSSFIATRPSSPAEYPAAVMTVLFRPFPWEAQNIQALVSSAEGIVLIVLFLVLLRRLAGLAREVVRRPYVAFALGYALLFIYAFSSFGNFGILVRQRVQLLPFVLVLLCLGPTREVGDPEEAQETEQTGATGESGERALGRVAIRT